MKKRFLFAVLPLLAASLFACGEENKEYIGIVSAMDNEIDLLVREAKIDFIEEHGGVTYRVGTLKNKNVIIASSGVGKIRCASGTTAMLHEFNVSKMIFTGIAGGVADETEVMDQVIATSIVEHDYGRLSDEGLEWKGGDPGYGTEPGVVYKPDAKLVDLAYESATSVMAGGNVFKGCIATGDQFIASQAYVEHLRKDFNALACEMEGASVAAVCEVYEKPYVVIRTLSDKADGQAHEYYENFADLAAEQSSRIVLKMMESL
jgi:adenosylhomocysteine nucleosidase